MGATELYSLLATLVAIFALVQKHRWKSDAEHWKARAVGAERMRDALAKEYVEQKLGG